MSSSKPVSPLQRLLDDVDRLPPYVTGEHLTEEQIYQYLDSGDPALDWHLSTCDNCAARLEAALEAERLLSSVDFAQRLAEIGEQATEHLETIKRKEAAMATLPAPQKAGSGGNSAPSNSHAETVLPFKARWIAALVPAAILGWLWFALPHGSATGIQPKGEPGSREVGSREPGDPIAEEEKEPWSGRHEKVRHVSLAGRHRSALEAEVVCMTSQLLGSSPQRRLMFSSMEVSTYDLMAASNSMTPRVPERR